MPLVFLSCSDNKAIVGYGAICGAMKKFHSGQTSAYSIIAVLVGRIWRARCNSLGSGNAYDVLAASRASGFLS